MNPNHLLPASQDNSTRPTSLAACGTSCDSGAGAREIKVPRILRVQLSQLSDAQWKELRIIACESAKFCNAVMADQYVRAMGYPEHELSAFRRFGKTLSGDVKVALAREAFTVWKRHSKLVMAGAQRLAEFQADRAIVCRAEHMSKGKRQIHAKIIWDGLEYRLGLRLVSESQGPRHEFTIWWKPQNDDYVQPVLDDLASGNNRLLKVSFRFERPGRKVFALLCYESKVMVAAHGERRATLGPLEESGDLWLRIESGDGRMIHTGYNDRVYRMSEMKINFSGILDRLRRTKRRTGKGHRRAYRNQLLKYGSFGSWAHGYLHQWSSDVIKRCNQNGVGSLVLMPMTFGEFPMAEFVEKLKYKAMESGIEIEKPDPLRYTTEQSFERPVQKNRRSVIKKREALEVLKT